MGILDRFLNRSVEPVPAPTAGLAVVPPARTPASGVTLETAAGLPAMYRALQIIATSVAQLPLEVVRGGRVLAPSQVPAIARKPSTWHTPEQFYKRTVIGLAGTGNAFWLVTRDPDGRPLNLTALDPRGMTWSTDRAGHRVWHHSDLITGPASYSAEQIKHLRLLEVPGHVMGLGPIQACRQALGGALDLRRYSDQWFTGAGVPTGVLSTDQAITPAEADATRSRWAQLQTERGVAVLGRGLSYAPTVLSPADAQFLESQAFSVTDVARMMGIPAPYLLAAVDGSTFTYQNREQIDAEFARTTLMAYLVEMEAALTDLLPYGQRARFDLSAWLRPDAQTEASVDEALIRAGVVTVDEVRARRGLPPLNPPTPEPTPAASTPAGVGAPASEDAPA